MPNQMRRASSSIALFSAVLISLPISVEATQQDQDASSETELHAAEMRFVRGVLPVLEAKCFACHGEVEDDLQGGLDLTSAKGLLIGGDTGEPAIEKKHADESPLYLTVKRESDEWPAMPPKDNDRLTAEQIDNIKKWIDAGAPWPDAERIKELKQELDSSWDHENGVQVATSGGLSDSWTDRRYRPEDLWAYQPVMEPSIPTSTANSDGQPIHAIDAFLGKRLNEAGIAPAERADRRTLIRRATFDLLGLPPTPEEVADFLSDPADDSIAFQTVVDRLLASPHYGERWGRHWLDITRYADSSGFANDYERGNAWRYRDYVIRSFNDDKPYDVFVREQLAGDEIDPNDPENLIATGFLRMGPWELTGMEVPKVARQRFLDDVTDSVGQVFLAHMLQCARCHDHKFDPVPTRDYYSMQAVFATTQLAERDARFLEIENTDGFEEQRFLKRRLEFYEQTLAKVDAKRTIEAARLWYKEEGLDSAPFEETLSKINADNRASHVVLDEVRRKMAQAGVHPDLIPPRHIGFEPQDFGLERIGRKGKERLAWTLERYQPYAFAVYSGPTPQIKSVYQPLRMPSQQEDKSQSDSSFVLTGGDPFSPGEPVSPGFLSAVDGYSSELKNNSTSPGDSIAGRRLALANWIVDRNNPLTARVMVNRVWLWHFNQPIAGNPNNFGATGKKPTHPELLDWLASQFVNNGWSIKSLHRLIMSSEAYQRSSRHSQPELVSERDPENQLFASFQARRLSAEELRDAILFSSGELNPQVGGIPCRPEMNLEVALQSRMVMGTFAEAWQPSITPVQRHRRTIYVLRLRGLQDPFFEVFNAPNPDLSCERRESSTVTPQVFALFNSELTYFRSLALADRLIKQTAPKFNVEEPHPKLNDSQRHEAIDRLFQIAYQRPPSDSERKLCLEHWEQMMHRHQSLNFEPQTFPTEVVRDAVEENTGEKFTYVEPLEAYAEFTPDLQPHEVGVETRALAEVCLVILNSNEFAYID